MAINNPFGQVAVTSRMQTPPNLAPIRPIAHSESVSTYRVNKLSLDLKQAQQRYNTRLGQRDILQKQYDAALIRKTEAEKQLGQYELVQVLLQKTSDYARQHAKTRTQDIVSEALNVVYGGNHQFIIDLVVRSNRPEADFYLSCDGVITQLKPPDYGRGGGKIDVITLALRLAITEILQVPGPLFLDEVGKHIDKIEDGDNTSIENLAYFLQQYSHQFGRQIILITHNDTLASIGDKGLRVIKKVNKAEVKPYELS